MGLLDFLGNFGTALEDAFTPAGERAQNQLIRERLRQEKLFREQEARQQEIFAGLFQGGTQPQSPVSLDRGAPSPTINRGQGGLAGMFPGLTPEIAAAFPERTADAFFSRFAPQGGKQSLAARINEIESVVGTLTSDERKQLAGIDAMGGLDDFMKRLQVDKLISDKEAATKKLRLENLEDEEKFQATSDALESGIGNLVGVFNANKNLVGTFGETGGVFQGVRDFLADLGSEFVGGEFTDVQVARDNLKKGVANVLLDTFEVLNNLGVITNNKFDSVKDSLASFETNPFTNAKILASMGRDLLSIIARKKIPINTAPIEAMIREADLMVEAQKRGIK